MRPARVVLSLPDGAADAVQAPALAELRTAQAKRALWPALRALRRRLRA